MGELAAATLIAVLTYVGGLHASPISPETVARALTSDATVSGSRRMHRCALVMPSAAATARSSRLVQPWCVLVTLIGPCIFEATSGNGAFLTLGQIKARADTHAAKGFTVSTRTAQVVDVGTEFFAAVAPDGQSRADVT
ncbi:MAG: hypothetical protein CK548_07035 [Opitutia bacterium]|nr:MAG: hypothetical protein CK548_07035 [Opitutae bacterium]